MKILYIKNNSERASTLQLRTVIYEHNNLKYVKKEVINNNAIKHLKKMKENYPKLVNNIKQDNIKIAPILDETKNSLTFKFIDGESLEKKFYKALENSKVEVFKLVDEYTRLLYDGFRTKKFDIKYSKNSKFEYIFGKNNYDILKDEITFDGISNIDLIFSNIIYSNKDIYIIDYEWTFDFEIPISFIIFRQFENFNFPDGIRREIYDRLDILSKKELFSKMNHNFIVNYVTNKYSFYQYANNYKKSNSYYHEHLVEIEELRKKILILENSLLLRNKKELLNNNIDISIMHCSKIIVKRILPLKVWNLLKTLKNYIKKLVFR